MVVNLADIVRRTNALSDITFHPQDLIRQPLRALVTAIVMPATVVRCIPLGTASENTCKAKFEKFPSTRLGE